MITIESMKIGSQARIVGFGLLSKSLRLRLYGLGLYQGATISLAHIAPLGCPVALQVGNTLLSLRVAEAQQLQLEDV